MLIHTYRGSSLLQCRIVSCVIGAVLGAYKPVTDGVSLQTGAAALHEEVLKEMSTRNCTLQVRDLHGFEIHHSLQELRICEMCAFWRARDEVLRSLLQTSSTLQKLHGKPSGVPTSQVEASPQVLCTL